VVVTGAEDSGHRGDSAGLDLRSHGERFCFLWGRWFVLRAGSRLVKLAARTAGRFWPVVSGVADGRSVTGAWCRNRR
jgi:hypothetical protein